MRWTLEDGDIQRCTQTTWRQSNEQQTTAIRVQTMTIPCQVGAAASYSEAVSTEDPHLIVYNDSRQWCDWTCPSSAHRHHFTPEALEHWNAAVETWPTWKYSNTLIYVQTICFKICISHSWEIYIDSQIPNKFINKTASKADHKQTHPSTDIDALGVNAQAF